MNEEEQKSESGDRKKKEDTEKLDKSLQEKFNLNDSAQILIES